LGAVLKNHDPRLPFAVSSLTLFATTAGLIWVERALARRPCVAAAPSAERGRPGRGMVLFLAACFVLALGFQIHTAFNSTAQYMRFARSDQLEYLLPVFWLGYYFVVFPGAALARRFGTLPVMAVAGIAGAIGALLSAHAPSLEVLIAGQALAGSA